MAFYQITFSPTGGTAKTAETLASAMAEKRIFIDLIRPVSETSLTADDICLIAVPSFGGRIPTTTAERLVKIHANGARAILVCTYGNRAYEDTLSELQDVLVSCGFDCIAAAAAVAEHSIIREFGAGRPDADDCTELIGFGEKIKERLENPVDNPLIVPGSHGTYKPYKNTPFVPAETDDCTNCGSCIKSCPTAAKSSSRAISGSA
jgi:NAD-dependent dihydropyrimidine dehydrogenase PreA subunit